MKHHDIDPQKWPCPKCQGAMRASLDITDRHVTCTLCGWEATIPTYLALHTGTLIPLDEAPE